MFKILKITDRIKALEASITSLAFWWAIVLWMPFNTFSSSSAYSAMNYLSPEWIWGLFSFSLGSIHLYGLTRDKKALRSVSLLIATGFWAFIAVMFLLGDISSTAFGTYAVISFISSWLYVEVGGKHGGKRD